MKTKQDLIMRIRKKDVGEIMDLLRHSEGVIDFIQKNFPDKVANKFIESVCKTTETAMIGAYRKPEESGRLMLDRCLVMNKWEKEQRLP